MSGEDEECPGQPVWHSVLLFCCKGMIEGIIVLLFIWLLVQVLFTKHLEVHLQILLGVGLAVFCFSLILGCFLCCRHMKQQSPEDKEAASSQAPPTAADDHVTHAQSPTPSSGMTSVRVQYEELEGEVLEYPSAVGSSSSSDDDFVTSRRRSRAASELNEQYKSSFFPLRRLSSPSLSSSLYRPMTRGRSSLPSLPKLSLLSKTRKVLEHYCTVTGDSFLYSERCRLTSQSPGSPGTPSALQSQCLLLEEASLPNYGSNSLCELTAPSLNFSLIFSPARQSLTISLLSLTGTLQRLVGVSVLAQLPPVRPDAVEMSARHCSLGPQLQGHSLVLDVGCLEELQSCVLRLTVFSLNALGHRASSLGELEIPCRDMVWEPELPITCTRELRQPVDYVENSVFCEGVEALGKILIQLQYQALIHRLKVTVTDLPFFTVLIRSDPQVSVRDTYSPLAGFWVMFSLARSIQVMGKLTGGPCAAGAKMRQHSGIPFNLAL
ncbi:uncharacterized protein syt18b [Chanos chanos]|uniref:Uncharacterized protein syt18b n=1 Tax=Chanos chanos TaxID=29144 RepID=A0A6J2UQ01_CHACN|nr:uncharacterized protein LOC115804797 [Chanos chanos]